MSIDPWTLVTNQEQGASASVVVPNPCPTDFAGYLVPKSQISSKLITVNGSPAPADSSKAMSSCPVGLAVSLQLTDSPSGWIIPNAAANTPPNVSYPYTVSRGPSLSAYVALGVIALMLTVVGCGILFYKRKRSNSGATGTKDEDLRLVPMLTVLGGAGTSLVSAAAVLSEFVPGYRIGGLSLLLVVLLGITGVAQVLRSDLTWPWLGKFGDYLSVFALVATVLVNPFLLLQGTLPTVLLRVILIWLSITVVVTSFVLANGTTLGQLSGWRAKWGLIGPLILVLLSPLVALSTSPLFNWTSLHIPANPLTKDIGVGVAGAMLLVAVVWLFLAGRGPLTVKESQTAKLEAKLKRISTKLDGHNRFAKAIADVEKEATP